MAGRPKITVVGSFNTDLMVRTPYLPVAGETILGSHFRTGPGGKGANQAVAAARLGADVSMVAKLGQDYYGDQAQLNLENEGINVDYVMRTTESHTGAAFIIVDDQGENSIVVASGTNDLLTPADVETAREAICGADILLLQLEVPLETVERAAGLAHKAGIRVILNPAPGQPLPPSLLAQIDVLTPNETEAQIISGNRPGAAVAAQEVARQLLGSGVKMVVMTLGAEGALLVTGGEVKEVPGFPVDVVDTTGAGDAFAGALAVALAEAQTPVDAVAFANLAAALQVRKVGTAPAMPCRDEVERYFPNQRDDQ